MKYLLPVLSIGVLSQVKVSVPFLVALAKFSSITSDGIS
jgi:hypothetical protein